MNTVDVIIIMPDVMGKLNIHMHNLMQIDQYLFSSKLTISGIKNCAKSWSSILLMHKPSFTL